MNISTEEFEKLREMIKNNDHHVHGLLSDEDIDFLELMIRKIVDDPDLHIVKDRILVWYNEDDVFDMVEQYLIEYLTDDDVVRTIRFEVDILNGVED